MSEFIVRRQTRDILREFGAMGITAKWDAHGVRIMLRVDTMNGGLPNWRSHCPPRRLSKKVTGLAEKGRFYANCEWEVVILPDRVLVASVPKMRASILFLNATPYPPLMPETAQDLAKDEWRDYPGGYRQGCESGVQLFLGPDPGFPLPELLAIWSVK